MHYVYATRGNIDAVNSVNEFLKTHPFTQKVKRNGVEEFDVIGGNLQPIQLWSYVFPEEHKDKVLNTLGGTDENRARWYGTGFQNQMVLKTLRKALHCKPLPKFDKSKKMFIDEDAMKVVSFMPIGVKYDQKDFVRSDGSIGEAL